MKDLGNIISSDQAITSKLLRMVNSAYYGFPRRISTISQALVVIGVEGLRSLIMGLSVQSLFKSEIGNILWTHSVCTAAAAKLITQKFGNVHPEESFVVGLVHDIGRVVLYQYFPEEFEYLDLVNKDTINTLKEEREFFGMDHGEVGARISQNWNLPEKIIESIKYHHKPNMAIQNQVALVVCIGEGIALYIDHVDKGMNADINEYIKPEFLSRLNIKEIPEQMIVDIKSKTGELMEVFGAL